MRALGRSGLKLGCPLADIPGMPTYLFTGAHLARYTLAVLLATAGVMIAAVLLVSQ